MLATELDALAPVLVLPMERPLYQRSERSPIDSTGIGAGERDVDVTPLFEQVFVDRERLVLGIRRQLQRRDQVGLAQVVALHPIEEGMAELVGYLSLGDPAFHVVFDERLRERVSWNDEDGRERVATIGIAEEAARAGCQQIDLAAYAAYSAHPCRVAPEATEEPVGPSPPRGTASLSLPIIIRTPPSSLNSSSTMSSQPGEADASTLRSDSLSETLYAAVRRRGRLLSLLVGGQLAAAIGIQAVCYLDGAFLLLAPLSDGLAPAPRATRPHSNTPAE